MCKRGTYEVAWRQLREPADSPREFTALPLRRPPGAKATEDAIAVFSDGMDQPFKYTFKYNDSRGNR